MAVLAGRTSNTEKVFQKLSSPHKGRVRLPNRMNFRKSAKGGGVNFNPKIYVADFWNFSENSSDLVAGPFPKHFVPILSVLHVRVLESNIKYNVLGLRGCLCLFLGQCNAMMKAWQRKITPSLNFPFELGWKRQSWINKELNFIPKLFCHQTQTSDELNIIIWCCINC